MADGPANSDERLSQINEELSKILEEKMEFLTRVLGDTQRFSQKIANTEIEIQRNTTQHGRLQEEIKELDKDLEVLTKRVGESTAVRDEQQNEKYAKEKELQRIDWEISDMRKANEEGAARIKDLDKSHSELEKENKKLESRIDVLNEGVERMKRVREEYLNRIKGLDQEMKSLAGGGGE